MTDTEPHNGTQPHDDRPSQGTTPDEAGSFPNPADSQRPTEATNRNLTARPHALDGHGRLETAARCGEAGRSAYAYRRPSPPCPCVCGTGGFCGGCGHAGCGAR